MTLAAARILLSTREHARIVPTLIHVPKEKTFKNSYDRAMHYATEGIQVVQGWIVHPYIKFDDERGQSIIEPYFWNYIEETNQHVTFSPIAIPSKANLIADNWDLYNEKTEWIYTFPPIIHLINFNTRHKWAARNSNDDLILLDDLSDKSITDYLTSQDTNIISSRILSGSTITS